MDTVTLVANQIDAGQKLLDQLAEKGIVVRAACWVKPAEEDRWSLYIATPLVDEKGALAAYDQVYRTLRSLGDAWISGSDVKLVSEKHPLVKDVLDIQRAFPHSAPTRPPRPLIGGAPVEEMYVYPLTKTQVNIYGLVFRGEPSQALHLSLEPHNPHTSLTVEGTEYRAETGINWVVAAPEGATRERDDIGRMVLSWDLHGKRQQSSANEVLAFAKLGLHGFRILQAPP